jgi:hypothetical protein
MNLYTIYRQLLQDFQIISVGRTTTYTLIVEFELNLYSHRGSQ